MRLFLAICIKEHKFHKIGDLHELFKCDSYETRGYTGYRYSHPELKWTAFTGGEVRLKTTIIKTNRCNDPVDIRSQLNEYTREVFGEHEPHKIEEKIKNIFLNTFNLPVDVYKFQTLWV